MSAVLHKRLAVGAGALAGIVAREEDHVTAIELAQWIRERRKDLRVIDVRTRAGYDTFHVPAAEHFPLDSLVRATFGRSETLVLYSEGGAHAAQAWVLLRARGLDRVYFLRGGLLEWVDEVMEPTVAANATPSERAHYDSIAMLSRYFGGSPHAGPPRRPGDTVPLPAAPVERADVSARVRRRGC